MNKSLATFARIHWPSEYKDYLAERKRTYSAHNRKRVRQVIKAIIINGNSEYRFLDWCLEQDKYEKNYQWQGGDC